MPRLNLNLDGDSEKVLNEYASKCEAILEWAETRERFDTNFVEQMSCQITEELFITKHQKMAIDNIINRFEISF